jgi:sulfatase modifying factor 1
MEWSVLTTESGMNPPTGDALQDGTATFHSASTSEYTANALPAAQGGRATTPVTEQSQPNQPQPNHSGGTISQFSPNIPTKTQPVTALSTDPNAKLATMNQANVISQPERRKPIALWLGIAVVLIGIAVALFLLIPRGGSGFKLTVKSAPPGSVVYVNDTRRDAVGADGTLKLADLPPGPVALRITHEGYADFTASVTANKGEERALDALLLPNEIEYANQGRTSQMVLIPAGEFVMGDDKHDDDEKPTHKVTLPAFYIDKYEVTNAQYKQFCDAEKGGQYLETAVGKDYLINNPTLPAIGIPYDDAAAFAKWAGRRLPSEEEWEKAASWDPATNTKRQWPWGDKPGGASANLGRNEVPKLAPVGTYAGDLSAYGVHDMAGNVSEWVDAFYTAYESNSKPSPKNGTEFGSKFRVTRGGSVHSSIDQSRTTFRGNVALEVKEEDRKYMLVGIRCAISANDPKIQEFLRARK